MNQLVTVIIPVYNAEKYLEECVESILVQTYKNLEIILINDGSKDKSLEICKVLSSRDERIIVVDKNNAGVSKARNSGLRVAKGEFVIFVDADDYVADTYVEKMLKKSLKSNADIVFCGYSVLNSSVVLNDTEILNKLCGNVTKKEIVKSVIDTSSDRLFGYVWRTLFKKGILENIFFDETTKISEDFMFLLMAIENAKVIDIVPEEMYYYRCNDGSATAKYMPTLLDDMNKINKWMYENICKDDIDYRMGYHCCVANTYLRAIQNVCRSGTNYSLKERIRYAKCIKEQFNYREHISIALSNNKLSKKNHISLKVLELGLDPLYIILFSIKCHQLGLKK